MSETVLSVITQRNRKGLLLSVHWNPQEVFGILERRNSFVYAGWFTYSEFQDGKIRKNNSSSKKFNTRDSEPQDT